MAVSQLDLAYKDTPENTDLRIMRTGNTTRGPSQWAFSEIREYWPLY